MMHMIQYDLTEVHSDIIINFQSMEHNIDIRALSRHLPWGLTLTINI